ncbi:MFS transporter [Reinekea blandensis]|uniref:Major facilitator superfamily (MFS) profile domain-containing protein n=1 Tax=Reinekea blandensis MED297 TaxID=314283 RepID=A4BAJ7_9GAMM|nr:MFS transporter [Reinekea blandensis]EAR10953.1 hypothetical protein MED297_10596 [Reinekea sp. MED297] [Reinekea blandensis MED297]
MLNAYWFVIRRYWPMLSFGLLTVFFGNFGQSFFISWYGASIQEQMGLSAAAYGSAYATATLISGLLIFFAGGMIDRLPLRVFLTLAALGLTAAALVMWQVESYLSLLIGLFLLRFCGQGLLPHTAMTTMARYFSDNRGKASSIASNGVPVGEMILPTLVVALIAMLGWQASWLAIALLIPILYLPLAHTFLSFAGPGETDAQTTAQNQPANPIPDGSRRTVLRDRRFWLALPLVLAPPFIVTGLFIQQGTILADKGWSPALFASAFVVYGGVHWLSSFVSGALVDRFSAIALLRFLGLPFAVGMGFGAVLHGPWVAFLMMAIIGIGIGMMGPISNSLWAEVYGTKHIGAIRALLTSIMIVSTSASPFLLGLAIDAGLSGAQLLLVMGAYAAVATVLAGFSYKTR